MVLVTKLQALFVVALTALAVGVAAFAYVFITEGFRFMQAVAIIGGFFTALVAGGM